MKKWILIFLSIAIILIIALFIHQKSFIQKNLNNNMKISSVFKNNENIPVKYTCKAEDISPPFQISDLPENTKSLVLIIDDPDAPSGLFTHWIVFNIMPTDTIEENSVPGLQGKNDFQKLEYKGPCPPSGTHHYHFKLYALDSELPLSEGASRQEIEKQMKEHILDKAEIVGLFSKE